MEQTEQQRWNRRVLTELTDHHAEQGFTMPADFDAASEVRAVRDEQEARDTARAAGAAEEEQA